VDFHEALRYLDGHVNNEATAGRVHGLSLARMQQLVGRMGDPQHAYPVIHITGTNGKGSTAHMTTALLRSLGLRVGTYTSPHLESITERIAVDGQPVSPETFGRIIADVAAFETLSAEPSSYFELVTAAALAHFAEVAVDVAVVEVGLLGRFDATNVCDARVAVITNIRRDHTDGLPGWRERIAEEKAGIIKPGSTLVLGETSTELRPIFLREPAERVVERGSHFWCETNKLAVGGRLLDLQGVHGRYEDVFVSLNGEHQGDNTSLAVAAVECFLDRAVPADVVTEALGSVWVPGRFEIVGRNPLVVLDAAHNPDGAMSLSRTLAEGFEHGGRRHLVLGMLRDRDPIAMLEALEADRAASLVVCTASSPRAVPAADLAAAARSMGVLAEPVDDPADAVERALSLADEADTVVVTGSFTVLGAARSVLDGR
jgi:dihydrofolate synthase/folylpolyglutamate synthase